jgi:hypothetical protein
MLPTLWPDDVVEIASCSVDDVRPGEIVLALREDQFFLHRFLARSRANGFLLRGDSMPRPDLEFPNEALVGRLVGRTRQNQSRGQRQGPLQDGPVPTRPFLPLRPWSRAIGYVLCHYGALRRLVLKVHGRGQPHTHTIEDAGQPGAMDVGAS